MVLVLCMRVSGGIMRERGDGMPPSWPQVSLSGRFPSRPPVQWSSSTDIDGCIESMPISISFPFSPLTSLKIHIQYKNHIGFSGLFMLYHLSDSSNLLHMLAANFYVHLPERDMSCAISCFGKIIVCVTHNSSSGKAYVRWVENLLC